MVPSCIGSPDGTVTRVFSRECKLPRGVCVRISSNGAELGTAAWGACEQGAATECTALCPTERNAISAIRPAFRTAACAATAAATAAGSIPRCCCRCCCCCCLCCCCCCCGLCMGTCTAVAWTCDGSCAEPCRIHESPGRIFTMTLPEVDRAIIGALTLAGRSPCWGASQGPAGDAGGARPKPRRGCRTAVALPSAAEVPVSCWACELSVPVSLTQSNCCAGRPREQPANGWVQPANVTTPGLLTACNVRNTKLVDAAGKVVMDAGGAVSVSASCSRNSCCPLSSGVVLPGSEAPLVEPISVLKHEVEVSGAVVFSISASSVARCAFGSTSPLQD
mmetsp:Transcript_86061/g.165655  ORF Transcript_86061/g.165655 Transcript_86061/m.165655 type:complete len:335 (+) Transcript_86061:207-1211(+)